MLDAIRCQPSPLGIRLRGGARTGSHRARTVGYDPLLSPGLRARIPMRDEVTEAIRLPLSFWRAAAVQQALGQRDIGGLFREASARGISQTRIGTAAGFSQGRVSEMVRG